MNRVKTRISWIIALAIALCVALGVAFGLPLTYRASAETTYAPTDVFDAGTGSTVAAYKPSADGDAYLGFLMKKSDAEVYFRRNLAFAWYEAVKQDTSESEDKGDTETQALDAERANPGKAVYFSMTFSFPAIEFETFTATFESAEENVSKDGKAINKLVFANKTVEGEKKFTVKVNDGKEYDLTAGKGDYKFSFLGAGEKAGDFALSLTYDGTEIFDGAEAFVNLGDNCAKYYSTSSSNPNVPLAFSVTLPEGSENAQKVLMKELNGQTFEVKGGTDGTAEADGTIPVTGGSISDNAPAVLVLSETVYAFELGKKFNLDYEAIDVLDKSISVNRRYYIAKTAEDGESYVHPDESKTADYKTLSSSVFFMPLDDKTDEIYLSIRFDLDDGVNTNNKVYLSWYAADTAVRTLAGAEDKKWDYIVANLERENPYYTVVEKNDETKENVKSANYDEIVENYQNLVNEAAEKTSAGTGSYIYLPSLRDLVGSDYADYRNLKFSVFYYTQNNTSSSTHTSQSSLSYNALKFEVAAKGNYKFRVLAVDSAGNPIQLYDSDGKLVDVTSVNVWDFDEIPEFTFYVKYDGITIEDMEEQTLGSRDTVYSVKDFDIIGLTGYSTDYKLYFIDESNAEFAASGATIPSYSDLVKNVKDFMEGDDYANARKSLVEIKKYNDEIKEGDDEWDESDNEYEWNPDSTLSFRPKQSGFYIVGVTVKDPNDYNKETTAYQVIQIHNPIDVTPGQSNWLKNNVTSVVLFGISGVLAVIIVILFLVKPSEKKIEEIDLEKLKGKNKKK